jgi:tRNA threonylcarbamoyladenosine biosynthesis protein TsaB
MPRSPPLVLAFDSGSPISSVAVARGSSVLAEASIERERSSPSLLAEIDALLQRVGESPSALGALCVLRGPGSFTGLRIGLATALGLHHALGVRVAAMPTLRVLAAACDPGSERVIAVVDALRGEWFVQEFERTAAGLAETSPPRLIRPESLAQRERVDLIGFGAARLAAAAGLDPSRALEPGPLATVAARLAPTWPVWDAALLVEPLYLRAAPGTPARAPSGRPRT